MRKAEYNDYTHLKCEKTNAKKIRWLGNIHVSDRQAYGLSLEPIISPVCCDELVAEAVVQYLEW